MNNKQKRFDLTIPFAWMLLFLSGTTLVMGQETDIVQSNRFEMEKKFNEDDFNIVSVEKDGLVLFREKNKFNKIGEKLWEFLVLDTLLYEKFNLELNIDNDHELIGYDYSPGKFYLLFRDGHISKSDWVIISLDLSNSSQTRYHVRNEMEIDLSHFLVTKSSMVLGGNIQNKPIVILYSFEERKSEVLPGFYRKETSLVNMNSNVNGTFNVLFLEKNTMNEENILRLNVFSAGGELLLQSSALFDRETPILSGVVNELEGEDLVIIGTYGKRGTKTSMGFYFIKVVPGDNNKIKFSELTKLKNFFRYLGEKKEAKIIQKIRKSGNANPFEYKVHLTIWDLHEKADGYWLTGEVIDPQYHSNRNRVYTPYDLSYYGYGFYGTRYYRSYNSMANYNEIVSVKYRQGFYVGFSKDGNLKWDASLPVEDIETTSIEQISAFGTHDNRYQIIYKNEDNGLVYTRGTFDNISRTDSNISIKLDDPNDVLKSESEKNGKVELWYDNVFFAWGFQRIQNTRTNQKRHVFYINKIHVE